MTGRRALGAHVSGPAALWLLRRVEADVADAVRFYNRQGRPDIASSIASAVDELREAARQWRASYLGSAERPETEAAAPSKGDGLHITPGWAAARLGVTSSRVRQLLRSGVIRGHREGGVWLVDEASFEDYRLAREQSA